MRAMKYYVLKKLKYQRLLIFILQTHAKLMTANIFLYIIVSDSN
jgi:hypothetical protein